ncbi:MAG: tRNA (adenosine(37)-N6)-dimethylallyltransferase MiaA [Tenericutes bacterium]|nr:tRNA (adenosine(37)-N6)-dimethylallyltransferase MiaA [Mycoplasmatota bacterium]
MSKIILLVGPTGTGKTALSISLAKKYDAVIINADSTQVYTEPLIATAKIKEDEKENIKHYLFDIVSLNDDYTLYDYQKQGRKLLDELIKENKNIIIVGGSGLYVKALLYNYILEEKKNINIDLSKYTNKELKEKVLEIDPISDIHENNRQRLESFLKTYYETGKIIKKTDEINKKLYKFISIGLTTDRETLYKMLDNRVDKMFEEGMLEEAKRLYDMNLKNYTNIIGYRELNDYFNGNISLEEAKELIKRNTRRYAKRQYTWFNNQMKDIKWFNTDYSNFTNTINEVNKYLDELK